MHLLLDERSGIPSASDFARLIACPASARMAQFARELGQEAHLDSGASLKGDAQHLAFVEGPEGLTDLERGEWEIVRERIEIELGAWLDPAGPAAEFHFEKRLWYSFRNKALYSGQPDLVVVQGPRAIVFDYKFGRFRVPDPENNLQLTIYAVLVARRYGAKEVRAAIASPFHQFSSFDFPARELRSASRQILVFLKNLKEAAAAGVVLAPIPGDQCQFCSGRLVCPAAKLESTLAIVDPKALPEGEKAALLLTSIDRAFALFKEVRAHYKRVLAKEPGAIPGWTLAPGYIRRSIPDLSALVELMEAQGVEFAQIIKTLSISVPEIEQLWAEVKGVPANQSKAAFKKLLGSLLVEKPNDPFLRASKRPKELPG